MRRCLRNATPGVSTRTHRWIAAGTACLVLLANGKSLASPTCPDEQETRQVPADSALCTALEPIVRKPGVLPLDEYEAKLGDYLRNFCHRDSSKGWKVDKHIRNTGPYIATLQQGRWSGTSFGTHASALVWYSPEMYQWLKANRPETSDVPAQEAPVPDGAIIVKEMYPAPAAACGGIAWEKLRPISEGAAIMVRDSRASHDGWFWGWFGWTKDWTSDWPERAKTRGYPFMGFGLYCTNCHSSAKANQTFSALKNIQGESGRPLAFLSQNFFLNPSMQGPHALRQARPMPEEEPPYNPDFLKTFPWSGAPPERERIVALPSETYDHVWAKAGERTAGNQFLTSNQCLGCHSAGGTGLHYDMTEPGADNKLTNVSPYGSWRGSPMALSGRDPIFFAQLASETQTFHPRSAAAIEDTCLGCHGVMGLRQFTIDRKASTGRCEPFRRETLDAVPYPRNHRLGALSNYGALARDGVSCLSCHQVAIGAADSAKVANQPQNACTAERQDLLNPGLSGFARTFTGGFLVGSPAESNGPFSEPKNKSMKAAIGVNPVHNETVKSSEVCGSCHTVHLPVLHGDRTIGHVYEQTTYPEWAFSAYRTGSTPDGGLPLGSGAQAQSCQGCHMPNRDAQGNPYRSKIASIQEYSNFPQAEHVLPPEDIDLPIRSRFGKHTLVGLNVFLLKMAWQFADILGIRRADPMLTDKGIDSVLSAERDMLVQAETRTAGVTVSDVKTDGDALSARVTIVNRVGHKFPSGVGFRRAFVEFNVIDAESKVLWSSGRTNGAGVIIDESGNPIAGELWWKDDCSARIEPVSRLHQPHYEVISRQNQAQIYEELVSAPPDVAAPTCGFAAPPEGALTTSFMSICGRVKDNRLLPNGFLGLDDRTQIAAALGAGRGLAEEAGPVAVGEDSDYRAGGGDALVYRVPMSELKGKPAAVQATLYYQATPPYYLQDRFCTASGDDTRRLYYVAGKLRLAGTRAQDWKLKVVSSGPVDIP